MSQVIAWSVVVLVCIWLMFTHRSRYRAELSCHYLETFIIDLLLIDDVGEQAKNEFRGYLAQLDRVDLDLYAFVVSAHAAVRDTARQVAGVLGPESTLMIHYQKTHSYLGNGSGEDDASDEDDA